MAPLHRVGLEDYALDAVDAAVLKSERIDAVTEFECQQSRFFRLAGAALERLDDAGAGAPGHMEPGHRIAVAHGVIAAAFRPADHRKNAVSHCPQPASFLAGGESEIGLRPASRPEVLIAVETCGAHPVLVRQLKTVLDAKPALLGQN